MQILCNGCSGLMIFLINEMRHYKSQARLDELLMAC